QAVNDHGFRFLLRVKDLYQFGLRLGFRCGAHGIPPSQITFTSDAGKLIMRQKQPAAQGAPSNLRKTAIVTLNSFSDLLYRESFEWNLTNPARLKATTKRRVVNRALKPKLKRKPNAATCAGCN